MTTDAPLHTRPFFALQAGRPAGCAYPQTVHPLGELRVPSGRLEASDPYVAFGEGCVMQVQPGTYPAYVTVADVSEDADGSHLRESYLSVIVRDDAPVASVRLGVPEGEDAPEEGTWFGVGVDAAAVGFADAAAAKALSASYDELERLEDEWFDRQDDPDHLGAGRANVPLPCATGGESLVVAHSGWGDGFFPIVTTHDVDGALLGIHIDLLVADIVHWKVADTHK